MSNVSVVTRLAGKAEEGKGRGGGRGKDASQTFKHKESSVVFGGKHGQDSC